MISTVILLLPLIHSRRVVVSYKRKYVHELLVNRLFKPAQEKVWLGELTVPQWPQLLTWDVKQQNQPTNNNIFFAMRYSITLKRLWNELTN